MENIGCYKRYQNKNVWCTLWYYGNGWNRDKIIKTSGRWEIKISSFRGWKSENIRIRFEEWYITIIKTILEIN